MEILKFYVQLITIISVVLLYKSLPDDNLIPAEDVLKPISIKIGSEQTLSNKISEKCNIYVMNSINYKVAFHVKNFKNVEKITITDRLPGNCGGCSEDAEVCQIAYTNSTSSSSQYVNFFTRNCFQKIYLSINSVSSNENTISSFDIDSNFYGESCVIKTETHLDYCGQSSMEDCRSCKRPGCSIVECGNYSNDKFVGYNFKI